MTTTSAFEATAPTQADVDAAYDAEGAASALVSEALSWVNPAACMGTAVYAAAITYCRNAMRVHRQAGLDYADVAAAFEANR